MALSDQIDQAARRRDPPAAQPAAVLLGKIRSSPTTIDEPVLVTVLSQSRSTKRGPCRWMPRDGAWPAVGDRCLIAFDENREPVVIWWHGTGNGHEPAGAGGTGDFVPYKPFPDDGVTLFGTRNADWSDDAIAAYFYEYDDGSGIGLWINDPDSGSRIQAWLDGDDAYMRLETAAGSVDLNSTPGWIALTRTGIDVNAPSPAFVGQDTLGGLAVPGGVAAIARPVGGLIAQTGPFVAVADTAGSANQLRAGEVFVTGHTYVTGIRLRRGATGAGNVIVTLYDALGQRKAKSASTAAGAAGAQLDVAFDAPQYLPPGSYYAGVITSADASFLAGETLQHGIDVTAPSFAAPASLGLLDTFPQSYPADPGAAHAPLAVLY